MGDRLSTVVEIVQGAVRDLARGSRRLIFATVKGVRSHAPAALRRPGGKRAGPLASAAPAKPGLAAVHTATPPVPERTPESRPGGATAVPGPPLGPPDQDRANPPLDAAQKTSDRSGAQKSTAKKVATA